MKRPIDKELPALAERYPVIQIADLPTPLSTCEPGIGRRRVTVTVKHDEHCGALYGGNKVRKLEFLLGRAQRRGRSRLATYGAAGSNHALATAVYAKALGFECTCLLTHQPVKPGIARTLLKHLELGTEVVYFGGNRARRIAVQRDRLQGRNIDVIPMGGSSWLGSLGFVNAAFELARQLDKAGQARPDRIYVATGTMGTAAGLALGLALAGLEIPVHAVRVTEPRFANPQGMERMIRKTAALIRREEQGLPAAIAGDARLVLRDEFFGAGYGRSGPAVESAVEFARSELGLTLESTYTGKAMAALIADVRAGACRRPLFWNTYNAVPLGTDENDGPDWSRLPAEFSRYFGPG